MPSLDPPQSVRSLIYMPYVGLAYAHFFNRNFAEAASAASRAAAANPRFSVPCYLHSAALIREGQLAEAQAKARVCWNCSPVHDQRAGLRADHYTGTWKCWLALCAKPDCPRVGSPRKLSPRFANLKIVLGSQEQPLPCHGCTTQFVASRRELWCPERECSHLVR